MIAWNNHHKNNQPGQPFCKYQTVVRVGQCLLIVTSDSSLATSNCLAEHDVDHGVDVGDVHLAVAGEVASGSLLVAGGIAVEQLLHGFWNVGGVECAVVAVAQDGGHAVVAGHDDIAFTGLGIEHIVGGLRLPWCSVGTLHGHGG